MPSIEGPEAEAEDPEDLAETWAHWVAPAMAPVGASLLALAEPLLRDLRGQLPPAHCDVGNVAGALTVKADRNCHQCGSRRTINFINVLRWVKSSVQA